MIEEKKQEDIETTVGKKKRERKKDVYAKLEINQLHKTWFSNSVERNNQVKFN